MHTTDLKGADIDPASLLHMELNDKGLIERLIARYGHLFCFVEEKGWRAFGGSHWRAEHAEHLLMRCFFETIARIREEAEIVRDNGDKKLAKKMLAFANTGAPQVNRVARCMKGLQSF